MKHFAQASNEGTQLRGRSRGAHKDRRGGGRVIPLLQEDVLKEKQIPTLLHL